MRLFDDVRFALFATSTLGHACGLCGTLSLASEEVSHRSQPPRQELIPIVHSQPAVG
jgi:hypothetical protein